ncbi:hypothetical protein C9374_008075 [Naegleria lovaniensis]|uniref:Uncharacterized protein n=1 Tax=Naegleria lovaniensis TaxID=51637 RepID=A0AA88GJP4_NAELO|nr:uncharacterized protein C9374_008075 [Naegleria lovaniensis]KAG2378436.1 hypothetical protein C9374_008075 [Naegleria lovaniensis]
MLDVVQIPIRSVSSSHTIKTLSSCTTTTIFLVMALLILWIPSYSENMVHAAFNFSSSEPQIEFAKWSTDVPVFELGSKLDVTFSVFAQKPAEFLISLLSQGADGGRPRPYSLSDAKFSYLNDVAGQVVNKTLQISLPFEVVEMEGNFYIVFTTTNTVDNKEIQFKSEPFKLSVSNISISWPTIVLILFFPPALILVAVIGAFVMCRRHKTITQQENQELQEEYQQQYDDDDVDIHFDHDDDDDEVQRPNKPNRNNDNEPRVAFVLEDDDDDDHQRRNAHIDDDDNVEKRGNFYYTRNV